MICPTCKFERTDEHDNPETECPNCKTVYSQSHPTRIWKFIAFLKKGKNWVILFFIAISLNGFWDAALYGKAEMCGKSECATVWLESSPASFYFVLLIYGLIMYFAISMLIKELSDK